MRTRAMLIVVVVATACGGEPEPAATMPFPMPIPEGWDGYATAEDCAPDGVHARLHRSAAALSSSFFPADGRGDRARERIDAIDIRGTRNGERTRAIELTAIDGSAREIAPLELDAMGRSDFAARLRALAPIVDEAARVAALREVEAMIEAEQQRYEASVDETAPEQPTSLDDLHAVLEHPFDEFLSDEPLDCYELPDIHAAIEGRVTEAALEHGADPRQLEDAIVALYERMVRAAR